MRPVPATVRRPRPLRTGRSSPHTGGVTYVYVPYVDEQGAGMQRFASEMVLALRRAGVELEVLVGEVHGEPAWLDRVPHRVILRGGWARRLPRALAALGRAAWIQLALPFVAERGATLLALGHEVAPLPLLRQVAVVHDLTDYKAFAERDGLLTRLRNRLWRGGLARSEAVVAISEATRRDLEATLGIGGDSVTVIYEGVDRTRFARPRSPQSPQRPFLLYVGTLDPHKNVPFLLRVYEALAARGHEVDLVVAGRYPAERAEALAQSVPEGLREGIRWVGFVDDGELVRLLAECVAFVFPSLNEGFGLAAAEAMACGAPVVSSSAGSLAEVVGEGGVLLPPSDEGAWVEALGRVLEEPARREALSARALARAEAFCWDRAAERYRAVLEGRPPALGGDGSVLPRPMADPRP